MYYVPWWLLAICLPVAAVAAYLALRGTNLSRWTLYALTVALAPVLLIGAAFVAVVLSTALSPVVEPSPQAPTQPVRTELTSPEPTSPAPAPEETTVPASTGPTPAPDASPTASPSASPAASASPTADQ